MISCLVKPQSIIKPYQIFFRVTFHCPWFSGENGKSGVDGPGNSFKLIQNSVDITVEVPVFWHCHHPEVVVMMVVVMVGLRAWSLLETDWINPATGRAAALSPGSMTWAI